MTITRCIDVGHRTKRVLLIDAHPIHRHGLAHLVNASQDLSICGESDDADAALGTVADLQPDIIVTDVTLTGSSAMALIRQICMKYSSLPVLFLSDHDEAVYAPRALRLGARGYVSNRSPAETILKAIRCILNGEIYVSGNMARKMLTEASSGNSVDRQSPVNVLTDRELEVYELIGRCLSSREIAQRLRVSIKTVNAHRAHMKKKLMLRNAIELTRHAVAWVQGA